jgi:hypothetical protein
MHSHPVIYYWARYEGFRVGATFLLPHCNNQALQGFGGGGSQNFHSFWEELR